MNFFGTSQLAKMLATVALVLSSALLPSVPARPLHHSKGARNLDYVSALAAANRFLYAWQIHDEESGVMLLTDSAKKSSSLDKLAAFFTHGELASYEIGRGKKVGATAYVFPLTLYRSGGQKLDRCRPRYARIRVVKSGNEDWGIDTLP